VLDQSVGVDERINGFLENLFQGIVLVGVCIMLVFGLRSSLMVMVAIPSSVIIGIGFVALKGYGLQQISIGGLVIALGLLVDNSIVVVENIERYLEMGHSRVDAAIKGTAEVGWAVVSGTVTTSMAFIPIICMPDRGGDFMRSLSVTVIFTLLVSLVIALTITPIIASRIMREHRADSGDKGKKRRLVTRLVQRIVEGLYRSLLRAALKHKVVTLTAVLAVMVFSFYMFRHVGLSFFPKAEKPQILVQIKLPEGANIDKTNRVASDVESILEQIDDVSSYTTSVGRGGPKIYYNFSSRHYESNYAEIFVQLKAYEPGHFHDLLAGLRERLSRFPEGRIVVREFEQGPVPKPPLEVVIKGDTLDVLKQLADHVESVFLNTAGTTNIENGTGRARTDIHFDINREKANLLGVPVHEIDQTIRTCIAGAAVSKYRDKEGNEYDIVLRSPVEGRFNIRDVDKIYVRSFFGRSVPLTQISSVRFLRAPSVIKRKDMERMASVTAFIASGYSLDDTAARVRAELNKHSWPHGYTWEFGGQLAERSSSFGSMRNAMIVALFGIFAVLVLQFRSYVQPLIVFSAVPTAVIGSIWALYWTGYTFSFTAFLGLISLIGIVVNDSIVLVEFINMQRENEGKSKLEAIRAAGEIRFIPIVLTTLTTVGGLLPLTLYGGIMWACMGWTIIGGLLASTFLTLVVVPVLYDILIREGTSGNNRRVT